MPNDYRTPPKDPCLLDALLGEVLLSLLALLPAPLLLAEGHSAAALAAAPVGAAGLVLLAWRIRMELRGRHRTRDAHRGDAGRAGRAAAALDAARDGVLRAAAAGVGREEIAAMLSADGLVVNPDEVSNAVERWARERECRAAEARRFAAVARAAL